MIKQGHNLWTLHGRCESSERKGKTREREWEAEREIMAGGWRREREGLEEEVARLRGEAERGWKEARLQTSFLERRCAPQSHDRANTHTPRASLAPPCIRAEKSEKQSVPTAGYGSQDVFQKLCQSGVCGVAGALDPFARDP